MPSHKLDLWIARMDRAARLLESRLDKPPSLSELAAAAAVSPFHFHRIWRALTGETIGQTLTRLRMENAKALLDGKLANVTDVALAAGFATSQSFARAFKRQEGVSPTEYRASPSDHLAPIGKLTVEIIWRDGLAVVALRREGQAYTELNETFGRIWSWAEAAGLIQNLQGIYGVPLDDPESVPLESLRYDAALAIGPADPPTPIFRTTLPAGRYALARHRGNYDGIEPATQRLFGEWLLVSGEEPGSYPVFYNFLNDPDDTPEADLETDILLQLKEKVVKCL